MESIGSAIAVHLLGAFIYDTVKLAKGEETSPLTEAIESTVRYFEGIEGLEATFRQWLLDPRVTEILTKYVEGETGRKELQIPTLVSALLSNTQFYLGEDSPAAGEEVIELFLTKVRAAYLARSSTAALHIANRQEVRFDALQEQIQHLTTEVQTGGGLKTTLQTHFDEATAKMEAEDFPAAKASFEILLVEIERAPVRDRNLERRVRVNLANLAVRFAEEDTAVKHYRIAAALDGDPKRAALSSAIADLNAQKPQEALDRLEAMADAQSSSFEYEYSAAKVGALLRLKRYNEAVELARSIHIDGKEVRRLELLGLVYRESGRQDAAEQAYRDALVLEPSRPELQHALADVLLAPAIEIHNQHPGVDLAPSIKERIDEAGNLLQSAALRFHTQGRRSAVLEVHSALAVVRALQGRFSDAIRVLEPVVQSGAASANDWRALGFAYINTNEPENAAAAFKKAAIKQRDPETEFLYTQTLLMSGKPDDVLAYVSERTTPPVSESNLRWHMVKSRALAAKRHFSQARDTISLAQRLFPNDAEVLLTSAALFDDTGQYTEAKNAFEEALKNATGTVEMSVRHAFGGFAARRKDFGRAVDLWKPLIRPNRPDSLLDNYVRVAYNSRKFAEITSVAKDIKNSGTKASVVFADVAAAAYERLDELGEASYWLEYLGDHYGNRPEHIARLSKIKLRLGDREQAIELLNASRATLTDANDIMGYGQAYSMLGLHRDALQLAHSAIPAADNADMQMAYVEIFLAVPDEIERLPEEIAKFQDILLKFGDRFPQSSQVQRVSIDPEHPLDSLRDTLTKASKHVQDVVELYNHNRIPLPTFARLLGKDLYQIWLNVIADPNLTLLSSDGTEQEQQQFQQILTARNAFLVEPVTLFTFSQLGLLDKLTNIGDVYIAQRSFDQLHELQARRRTADRQTGVMGMIDGQFFIQEITPEEAVKMNAALNTATQWAAEHAKAVGLTEPLSKDDKKWAKVLGAPAVAVMITAKQRDLTLITDDKTFGDIAEQNYGIPFVNTQAVLFRFLTSGAISQHEYDSAVLKLFEAGYTLTQVNEGHLFTITSEEQFQLTERVKRALRVFEPAAIAIIPACTAVAGLLRRIYLEPIPDQMRERLSFYLLDALAANHPKAHVKRLVRELVRQQTSAILVLQLAKIEQVLNRW
jgi:tetratricopeptide (TPR) repeat protein